ncbi:MAG: iron ABC transporter permease [Thermoguttaceae bacterium]|nr:iron ABC transporter permease [Thermoguttaceae bacterium]
MRHCRRRTIFFLSLLIVLLILSVLGSLFVGAVAVPLSEFRTSGIIQMRLARILLAVVAGASLSVAGVVLQALVRNPLAEPYLLGVSSGAGVSAAATIFFGWYLCSVITLPFMAFLGAILTVLAVSRIARQRDGSTPIYSLLLSGSILNAILGSLLMFVVSISSSENLHNIMWWLLGNLQIFDWRLLGLTATIAVVTMGYCIIESRNLNLISLGDEPAAQLGLDVSRVRLQFLIIASLLTAAVVAACGLIGFVGLIVPHTVRLLVGADHRRLLPCSAVVGAIFLTTADSVARTVMAPVEIPIGVITASLGGPFFLWLLRTRRG